MKLNNHSFPDIYLHESLSFFISLSLALLSVNNWHLSVSKHLDTPSIGVTVCKISGHAVGTFSRPRCPTLQSVMQSDIGLFVHIILHFIPRSSKWIIFTYFFSERLYILRDLLIILDLINSTNYKFPRFLCLG